MVVGNTYKLAVPVLFSDGRWDFGSGLDYMTIKNQEQMFGYWFYQNGSPTPQNPLNMTREQFDARYRLNEQEEEEEPDDDIEVEISSTQQSVATGEDPILAYAEQISSKKFPGTLVKEFRADKLTDGTFLTELNWTALRHTLRYDSLNKFDNMPPSVFATLPEGISFTTVEILTFFPGCINDAFFAYRVVAVGWTPAGLTNAFVKHRTHTDTYDALRERIQRRLRSGLRLVTEDDRIALDVYSKLPISRRSIVEDYSSNTFATTYAARNGFTREFKKDVPRADDVKLSQLLEAAGTLPVGDDAGTLTRLVNALKKGDVDDMKMSQVANFMLHNPNYEVQHNAEKDNMRAAWWNAQEKKG